MMSQAALAAMTVFADIQPQEPVNNFGDTRGGALAGPLGLFLIIVLAIATVLLIRNMNSRIRKLPSRFPGEDPASADDRTLADDRAPADDREEADRDRPVDDAR
jgi:hypothetical protein